MGTWKKLFWVIFCSEQADCSQQLLVLCSFLFLNIFFWAIGRSCLELLAVLNDLFRVAFCSSRPALHEKWVMASRNSGESKQQNVDLTFGLNKPLHLARSLVKTQNTKHKRFCDHWNTMTLEPNCDTFGISHQGVGLKPEVESNKFNHKTRQHKQKRCCDEWDTGGTQ